VLRRISRIEALTDGSSIRPQYESRYRRYSHGHWTQDKDGKMEIGRDATSVREGHAVAA